MYRFSESRRLWGWALALVLVSGLVALAEKARREGVLVVGENAENFRTEPNGRKLGTLMEGTEIEKIAQEGKWVRFRVEGWVWGPSLEGFEEEKSAQGEAEEVPRLPLLDEMPRIKRLVNERYGIFYGLDLDEDLKRLRVRFRVSSLEREALERRQMAVQKAVLEILQDKVEFSTIRIETNRPDGSGPVGIEIAETAAAEVLGLAEEAVEEWKARTRISTDGGETWNR